MNSENKYLCAWDSSNYGVGATEIKSIDWFSEDEGYTEDNQTEIKKLDVGQFYDFGDGHIVVRMS